MDEVDYIECLREDCLIGEEEAVSLREDLLIGAGEILWSTKKKGIAKVVYNLAYYFSCNWAIRELCENIDNLSLKDIRDVVREKLNKNIVLEEYPECGFKKINGKDTPGYFCPGFLGSPLIFVPFKGDIALAISPYTELELYFNKKGEIEFVDGNISFNKIKKYEKEWKKLVLSLFQPLLSEEELADLYCSTDSLPFATIYTSDTCEVKLRSCLLHDTQDTFLYGVTANGELLNIQETSREAAALYAKEWFTLQDVPFYWGN
jgi:hypothetical protein